MVIPAGPWGVYRRDGICDKLTCHGIGPAWLKQQLGKTPCLPLLQQRALTFSTFHTPFTLFLS